MPFRLTRAGVEQPTPAERAALHDEYRRVNCVTLPGFFDAHVVGWLQRRMATAAWETLVHEDLDPPAIDLRLADDVALGVIHAMVQGPDVYGTVRAITDCDEIGSYGFRVYRMDGAAGHTDTWHGDDDGNRLVTMSVNIGTQPFEGGALEIRERATGRILHHVRNTGTGDAILFRIGADLEHRVEEVRGPVPKYAIAGWFQRQPVHGKIPGHFL
jgi:hypothetical protein